MDVTEMERDISHGEFVEKELNTFVAKRDKQRRKAEGERPKEEAYEPNLRAAVASAHERLLWEKVHYHEAMIQSHSANFKHILDEHRRGLERARAMLGIGDAKRGAA